MRSAAEERAMYSRQREFDAYLWDIHKYGVQILELTHGRFLADFEQDGMLRAGVEHCLSSLAAALLQMSLYHPEAAKQVEHGDAFVELQETKTRNPESGHAKAVWDAIEHDLLVLIAEVTVLLDEWHQG